MVLIVNAIDTKIPITSEFVTKTHYDSDRQGPYISGLNKKTNYNTKITEIESKIPIVTY